MLDHSLGFLNNRIVVIFLTGENGEHGLTVAIDIDLENLRTVNGGLTVIVFFHEI